MRERKWNVEVKDGEAFVVGRIDDKDAVVKWLEDEQPEFEDAVARLVVEIQDGASKEDLLLLANYIEEFYQDNDPRSMGWVGSDGLP